MELMSSASSPVLTKLGSSIARAICSCTEASESSLVPHEKDLSSQALLGAFRLTDPAVEIMDVQTSCT